MDENYLVRMRRSSHLSGGSAAYIETMYEQFLENPYLLAEGWRDYFEKLPMVDGISVDFPHGSIIRHFERLGRNRLRARPERVSTEVSSEHERKQVRVLELISAYRHRGHRRAVIDPLNIWVRDPAPELDLAFHDLTEGCLLYTSDAADE